MLDALREGQAMESTDRPEDADLILLNTRSIREKARRRSSASWGATAAQGRQARSLIGVGGCVASQEGHAIADAPFGFAVRPPNPASPAGDDRRAPRRRALGPSAGRPGRHSSEIESSIAFRAPGRRFYGLCIDHGGVFEVLQLLRGALHPGEEISRPREPVLAECEALARGGVREINLPG